MKGVSDLLAVVIFIGLALVASTVFILVLQGYFASRAEQVDLSRVVSSEKSSISLRLLDVKGFYALILFKGFKDIMHTSSYMMEPPTRVAIV